MESHHFRTMPNSNRQTKRSKFTRGEKCLFAHLIITFVGIMLMALIYLIHLCVVKHTRNEMLSMYYRRADTRLSTLEVTHFESIGVVYLNMTPPPVRVVCNTLLLAKRWSLAPAQCTSMRDHPEMSDYLPKWRIKYKLFGKFTQSGIKRTLTHSRFNRGDFHNNIGLFEHSNQIINDEYYVAPRNIVIDQQLLQKYAKEMFIVNWQIAFSNQGDISHAMVIRVRPVSSENCYSYASPIVEQMRDYEFCVNFYRTGPTAGTFVFKEKTWLHTGYKKLCNYLPKMGTLITIKFKV
ncbi:uncharacterized protein LOC113501980 isoform X2 [Trichoplusia ni]|uniref:Uncharacterized protein LOC113501980 isoform X2 n=1 Tax=Trichoplusia ni TaxID=7111 RepID=A0A7E5WFN9_TRINI|nr:uncharacterized protein LOC113501980 isoform X2 [Trichoplusia ni]